MRTYYVVGGARARLYIEETGNPKGKPLLFIHGFSQSRLSWNRQINSYLARDFRLVVMDIRGHGNSEKPTHGYDDPKIWADDIQAVIHTLDLYLPILVAWSYGGLIVCDYIRIYGDKLISGINLVSALTMWGTATASQYTGLEFKNITKGLISDNAEESSQALQKFVQFCFFQPPTIYDYYFVLGYNSVVPPYVRRALSSRTVVNDDLLPHIYKPVLITHGIEDKLVLVAAARHSAKLLPVNKLSLYPGVGHSPFWEQPDRFNEELKAFAHRIDLRAT